MASPEENKVRLEELLDRSTINFNRFIAQQIGGIHNGTALGAVCIGWGGYPSNGGDYSGYFDFRTNAETTIVFNVAGMAAVRRVPFLVPFESGRGHQLLYLPTSLTPQNRIRIGSMEESPYAHIDPASGISITDEVYPFVEAGVKEIKEGEFWTIRKYIMQSRDAQITDAIGNEDQFGAHVERAFNDTPTPGAYVRFRHSYYTIRDLPGREGNLVLEDETGTLTVPRERVNLDVLAQFNYKAGEIIPVSQYAISDNPDDWKISRMGVGLGLLHPEKLS